MSLLDKLAKEAPAGRGVCLLSQKEIKEISQARAAGYSWEQVWKAVEKYNSPQALAGAFYREIESKDGEQR